MTSGSGSKAMLPPWPASCSPKPLPAPGGGSRLPFLLWIKFWIKSDLSLMLSWIGDQGSWEKKAQGCKLAEPEAGSLEGDDKACWLGPRLCSLGSGCALAPDQP